MTKPLSSFFILLYIFFVSLLIVNAKLNYFGGNIYQNIESKYHHLVDDREISSAHPLEKHKLRWAYRAFEINLYDKFLDLSDNGIKEKYLVLIHYSLIVFLTSLFSIKIFKTINKEHSKESMALFISIYFLLYLFVMVLTPLDELFTFVEVMALTVLIYATINNNFWLFILATIIAVTNRESGVIFGFIYSLYNWRHLGNLKISISILFGFFVLAFLNLDIIMNIEKFLLYRADIDERWGLLNLSAPLTLGEKVSSLISYLVFFSPLAILVYKIKQSEIFSWAFKLVLIYSVVIFFGSYFGNMILLLLFVPVYVVFISLYFDQSCKKVRGNEAMNDS